MYLLYPCILLSRENEKLSSGVSLKAVNKYTSIQVYINIVADTNPKTMMKDLRGWRNVSYYYAWWIWAENWKVILRRFLNDV